MSTVKISIQFIGLCQNFLFAFAHFPILSNIHQKEYGQLLVNSISLSLAS
jgi:hypothetical protein